MIHCRNRQPFGDPMRTAAFALLSIMIGLIFALAAMEIGLRVAGTDYPIFWTPDPVAGALMWPNLQAEYTLEGQSWVEVNSSGFRDHEHQETKPVHEFRIAFLGDSYTEAVQVPFQDAYWNVARRGLKECDALNGRIPTPLNFGISGLGTGQQLEILRKLVWDYDPDLVVLAFVSNDITDNSPVYGGVGLKPFYFFDDSDEFVLDDSFKTSVDFTRRTSPIINLRRRIIQKSRLLKLLVEIRGSMVRKQSLQSAKSRSGFLNRPPATDALVEAWRVTEEAISQVASDVESRSKDFLLFSVTTGFQVHPDPAYRHKRLVETGGGDMTYWNSRLAALADRKGIDYVDLVEPLRRHAESNRVCLHGFDNAVPCGGHWNSEGHRIAGETLAKSICRKMAD